MTSVSPSTTPGGLIPPVVTDQTGWRSALANLARYDNGKLVRRLDEFRALAGAAPAGADWKPATAAAVLGHIEDVVEAKLRRNTRGDLRSFLTARSIAIDAISDIDSARYDGLRSHFAETLHHITVDAERHERGPLLSASRFVSLESVADVAVDSEEETILFRDAILRAIAAEPRERRRIALALKYQGFTDAEIASKVGVSAQRVNIYVRDFADSPLLADFKDGLSARRKE